MDPEQPSSIAAARGRLKQVLGLLFVDAEQAAKLLKYLGYAALKDLGLQRPYRRFAQKDLAKTIYRDRITTGAIAQHCITIRKRLPTYPATPDSNGQVVHIELCKGDEAPRGLHVEFSLKPASPVVKDLRMPILETNAQDHAARPRTAPNVIKRPTAQDPSRRDLFGSIPTAALLLASGNVGKGDDPQSYISRLSTDQPVDLHEMVDRFVNAKPNVELMYYYSVFFERVMHTHRTDALNILLGWSTQGFLRDRYKANQHRLLALPAAVAAHSLSITADVRQRDLLGAVILETVRSTNSQAGEITLQNLTTAMVPNPDVMRRFSASHGLVPALGTLVRERLREPRYLNFTIHTMLFLLNLRLLLKDRGDNSEEVDRVLAAVSEKPDPATWYVRRFIDLHRAIFTTSAEAPPEFTQSSLAGGNIDPSQRRYYQHIALFFANSFYENFCLANGPGSSEVVDTAKVVYRKIGARLKSFSLLTCHFPSRSELDNILPDSPFKAFLKKEFHHMLQTDPGIDEFKPDMGESYLAALAPFAPMQEKQLILRTAKAGALRRFLDAFSTIRSGRRSAEDLEDIYSIIVGVSSKAPVGGAAQRLRAPRWFNPDLLAETAELLDDAIGEALDEEQRALGNYDLS